MQCLQMSTQTHTEQRNIGQNIKRNGRLKVQVTQSENSVSCGLHSEDADAVTLTHKQKYYLASGKVAKMLDPLHSLSRLKYVTHE